MEATDRIMNLLNYVACLSEPDATVPETVERMREIHLASKEVAHEVGKVL